MSICIAADWKETLQNQNAGVRSVMTWEGFVSNHQFIHFDNLRVAKRFVQYLITGMEKLNNARTEHNGHVSVNTSLDVLFLLS